MNTKLIITSIILCCVTSTAHGYEVKNIAELSKDLSARTKNVKDDAGKDCALIRVDVPSVNGVVFDNTIIGAPEYLPGEYNVFIPENTTSFSCEINGETCIIDFSHFDVSIEGKKCYRVIIDNQKNKTKQNTHTFINANYDNVVVMIDGCPVGQTPLQLDNISPGKHTLTIPNISGVTMPDTIIEFGQTNSINLTLHEQKKNPVYVDLAVYGFDSSTWNNVFGTNVKEKDGKQGVVDYTGQILVPFDYDNIFPELQNGYYVVRNGNKNGLYDLEKGLAVPCIYDHIITNMSYLHDSYMPVCNNGKWGVISPLGELSVPICYDRQPHCCDDAIVVYSEQEGSDGAYGFASYEGKITVQPRYKYLSDFANGYAFFEKQDKTQGFVDVHGNETIIPATYELGRFFYNAPSLVNGLFPVKDVESGKWGYMNIKLDIIIPTIYEKAPNFNQGITLLKCDEYKIVLNSKGGILIDSKEKNYTDIEIICHTDPINSGGSYYGATEAEGKMDNIFIKVVNMDGLCGILDIHGNTIVPCNYQEHDIQWFFDNENNYFAIKEEEETTIIDQKRNILFSLPSSFDIREITDGFVLIRDLDTNSYGYLNMRGEILANCIYGYNFGVDFGDEDYYVGSEGYNIADIIDELPVSEGLAILNIGDRYGFIDNTGNVKVPLIYTAVTPFDNGVSFVRSLNGQWTKIFKNDLK